MTHDILHIMAGAKVGGAENFFMRLVPALQKEGMQQIALIRHHVKRESMLQDAGIATHSARFFKHFPALTRAKVTGILRKNSPKMTIAWMNRAAQALPENSQGSVFCARLGGYYKIKNYRRCQYLIGNTKGICAWLVTQGWPKERVEYLPNFVVEQAATPIAREVYDTPEGAPLLLGLGRLHPNKGFDLAIMALRQLPDAYLWLAGSGPLDEALRELAKAQGVADRVRFLGWVDDPHALLAAADIMLCSSRIEPLGNIVLEAWAQKTPVVAMNIQGPAELITHGTDGLLFAPENLEELVDQIRTCLDNDDLRTTMITKGYVRYFKNFSQARICQQYRAFFEQVTG
ncbi:MAG: glycosyltransferase [Pseudomonadota bacterium]